MSLTTTLDREAILSHAAILPVAPQILARLYRLLQDANSGVDEIADLLKRDPALATRVIRVANSPACGGAGSVGTIEEALARVGFGEAYRLVGFAAGSGLGERGLRCYGIDAGAFQRRNHFAALAAEGLAGLAGLDARAAYTAGLLRGIGQLMFDAIGGDFLAEEELFPAHRADGVVAWEVRTFGVTHTEVAGALLTEWGFPEDIVLAVEHRPGASAKTAPLAHVMALTDDIVRLAGLGIETDAPERTLTLEALSALGLDADACARVREGAMARLIALETGLR